GGKQGEVLLTPQEAARGKVPLSTSSRAAIRLSLPRKTANVEERIASVERMTRTRATEIALGLEQFCYMLHLHKKASSARAKSASGSRRGTFRDDDPEVDFIVT